jgi:class 3 adenylate cyclase
MVAIVFADISGFTRLSEQVLVDPAKIGLLVDTWGDEVVELTWANGGVFDKMVGDCLIALFGPPFYETTPGERLEAALRTAKGIIEVTQKMPDRPGLERLKGAGIGVSTGVNLCPLFVGRFGPNENFTGFSSGMNNTARLQHLAGKDEILVMSDAIAQLGGKSALKFGDERSAPVKNVAQPLRFRPLL